MGKCSCSGGAGALLTASASQAVASVALVDDAPAVTRLVSDGGEGVISVGPPPSKRLGSTDVAKDDAASRCGNVAAVPPSLVKLPLPGSNAPSPAARPSRRAKEDVNEGSVGAGSRVAANESDCTESWPAGGEVSGEWSAGWATTAASAWQLGAPRLLDNSP